MELKLTGRRAARSALTAAMRKDVTKNSITSVMSLLKTHRSLFLTESLCADVIGYLANALKSTDVLSFSALSDVFRAVLPRIAEFQRCDPEHCLVKLTVDVMSLGCRLCPDSEDFASYACENRRFSTVLEKSGHRLLRLSECRSFCARLMRVLALSNPSGVSTKDAGLLLHFLKTVLDWQWPSPGEYCMFVAEGLSIVNSPEINASVALESQQLLRDTVTAVIKEKKWESTDGMQALLSSALEHEPGIIFGNLELTLGLLLGSFEFSSRLWAQLFRSANASRKQIELTFEILARMNQNQISSSIPNFEILFAGLTTPIFMKTFILLTEKECYELVPVLLRFCNVSLLSRQQLDKICSIVTRGTLDTGSGEPLLLSKVVLFEVMEHYHGLTPNDGNFTVDKKAAPFTEMCILMRHYHSRDNGKKARKVAVGLLDLLTSCVEKRGRKPSECFANFDRSQFLLSLESLVHVADGSQELLQGLAEACVREDLLSDWSVWDTDEALAVAIGIRLFANITRVLSKAGLPIDGDLVLYSDVEKIKASVWNLAESDSIVLSEVKVGELNENLLAASFIPFETSKRLHCIFACSALVALLACSNEEVALTSLGLLDASLSLPSKAKTLWSSLSLAGILPQLLSRMTAIQNANDTSATLVDVVVAKIVRIFKEDLDRNIVKKCGKTELRFSFLCALFGTNALPDEVTSQALKNVNRNLTELSLNGTKKFDPEGFLPLIKCLNEWLATRTVEELHPNVQNLSDALRKFICSSNAVSAHAADAVVIFLARMSIKAADSPDKDLLTDLLAFAGQHASKACHSDLVNLLSVNAEYFIDHIDAICGSAVENFAALKLIYVILPEFAQKNDNAKCIVLVDKIASSATSLSPNPNWPETSFLNMSNSLLRHQKLATGQLFHALLSILGACSRSDCDSLPLKFRILQRLLTSRTKLVSQSCYAFISVVQHLLKRLCDYSDLTTTQLEAAEEFSKLVSAMSQKANVFVTLQYFVVFYVDILHDANVPSVVRTIVTTTLLRLWSSCDRRTLVFVGLNVPSRCGYFYSQLHEEYERYFKFKGEV